MILGLYYVGELTSMTLSLPLPGSLIGMILLFVLLQLHTVELEQIATASDFLLRHLSLFPLPAGVALTASFSVMEGLWIWMLIICLMIMIITIGCSGRTIQHMTERKLKP